MEFADTKKIGTNAIQISLCFPASPTFLNRGRAPSIYVPLIHVVKYHIWVFKQG